MSEGRPEHMGLFLGQVVDRNDPENLGRIKLTVPGLLEPSSDWAWPLGSPGGGSGQRGHIEPPATGATVGVFLRQGEVEEPYWITGPWGSPEGGSDVPEEAAVEGDDRQNAVTVDEEWRIERDSRTSPKRYLIRHKNSDLAVLIDADADKVHLVREGADQALVRGTEYRSAEASVLASLASDLTAAGVALSAAGTDPTLVALASAAAGSLNTAGGSLSSAGGNLSGAELASDATAYLSQKGFTD